MQRIITYICREGHVFQMMEWYLFWLQGMAFYCCLMFTRKTQLHACIEFRLFGKNNINGIKTLYFKYYERKKNERQFIGSGIWKLENFTFLS